MQIEGLDMVPIMHARRKLCAPPSLTRPPLSPPRRHCSAPIDAAAGALESADGEYAAGLRTQLASPVREAGRHQRGIRSSLANAMNSACSRLAHSPSPITD